MEKKGQITVFIILGVLLLTATTIFLVLSRNIAKESFWAEPEKIGELNSKAESLKSYVDSCINDVGERAIITLGYNGGREKLVEPYFNGDFFDSNYLYYLGSGEVPSVEAIEDGLEQTMNEHLPECLPSGLINKEVGLNKEIVNYGPLDGELNKELVNYGSLFEGLELDIGKVNSTAIISNEAVMFTVKWPLTLKVEGGEKTVEDFSPAEFNVRIKKIISFVEGFVKRLEYNPYFIDTAYLLNQNLSYDLTVAEDDTYLVLVTDEESVIDYRPFQFLFAGKVETEGVLI